MSEDFQTGATDVKDLLAFVFLGLGYPTQKDHLYFHAFTRPDPGEECVDCGSWVVRLDSSGLGFNPKNICVSCSPKC